MTVISRLRRKHMASLQPANAPLEPRHGLPRLASFSLQSDRSDRDGVRQPSRAHTFHNDGGAPSDDKSQTHDAEAPDSFETGEHSDGDEEPEPGRASVELDDLPIELITLTDSFVESLSAKVHPKPPNIQKLSHLFQDFYALGSSQIGTHISALASRHANVALPDPPPPPSSSLSSTASRLRSKAASIGSKDKPKAGIEQQMLTSEELASRKQARKALEAKRSLLEEAMERRLCEGIYDRIYRHRSTQDEAQDAKLRSKTAALALVGIGPSDLGVVLGDDDNECRQDKTNEIREQLEPARRDIVRMSESRYPLGKLNRLKAAHKSIVDTLAQFHPSAAADEIMPMLIYTLITLPPEHLHVISDLHFIQSFRWEIKLYGEAAYCLTNLEAAISFLETVDLATLRADEHPCGPAKGASQQGSPKKETFPPAYNITDQSVTTAAKPEASSPAALSKPEAAPGNRKLSDLVNTPAQAIGAASDAVLSTADQGLKTISNSLGESYSFLVGKLKERQEGPKESLVVPKTLDDARKLMSTPPPDDDDHNDDVEQQLKVPKREDRALNLITGRRDHSADSTRSRRSVSSSKKVLFADAASPSPSSSASQQQQQSPAMLEQMRSLGNTFNPMARLSNLGIRGFGRSSAAAPSTPSPTPAPKTAARDAKPADGGDLATVSNLPDITMGLDLPDSVLKAFPDLAAMLPPKDCKDPKEPKEAAKVAPPMQRFMELKDAGDLKLSEVADLLRDYHRLGDALKQLGLF